MAFESVQIQTTRNGSSLVSGYREDLAAADVVAASLTSLVGVTSVLWELIGRPEYSGAGGAGPEPIALATAPTCSFTVDSDSGAVHLDGTYLLRATINPGSPGQVRKTVDLVRLSSLTIPGMSGARHLRKLACFESLEDTSVPTILQGWATQANRWFDLVKTIALGGGVIETLAGAYAEGTSSTDQTLLLDDSRGGGVVLNATGGGFTGASAIRINTAAGGPFVVDRATGDVGIGIAAPLEEVHIKSASPGIRFDRTSGTPISLENITDVLNVINRTGPVTIATFPGTGGMRTDFGVGIGAAVPTAAAFAMGIGSTAPVSASNTGRFRYNEVAQQFEVSQNGGAYTALGSGSTTLLEADGATTGSVPLNTLAFPATGTVVARINSRRDFVYLDRTSTATVDNFLYFAALGGVGRWVRMRIADPFWTTQAAFFIDPANVSTTANDDNTGVDGTHQLRSLSEYHLRLWAAQLPADQTITIADDLNANDTVQGFFNIARDGVAFTGYPHYFGVQRVVYSGTANTVVARNGATSQPTLVTSTGIASNWTLGDGTTSFVGLVVRRTSDGSTARVVQDMGGKQAWLSQPLTPGAIPITWVNGDAITVYDVPNLGQQVTTHAGVTQFTDLKVSGRWMSAYGQMNHYNCTGDVIVDGGFGYSQNGLTGLISGASFLVSRGFGSIAGGYHRLICASGEMRLNVTPTVKALQVEGDAVITAINGGAQGTADIEFNQTGTMANLNPAINFLGISGGRIINSGFTYGTIGSSNTLINFQGRGQRMDVAHVPTVTGGAGASQITTAQGATASTNVSVLATRMYDDLAGNSIVGPAGTTLNDNRGQTILNVGSAAGVGTSAVNWNDVIGAIGGSPVSLTPGSVVIANASGHLDQDNANLFWDDTHNRLGIGNTSPTVDLTISRSANGAAAAVVNNPGTGSSSTAFWNAQSGSLGSATATVSMGMTGTNYAGAGTIPNLGSNMAVVTTITVGPNPTLYLGSHGVITMQTGATQAERLKILTTGEVQLSSLAAGGLVKAAAGGQLAIAVAGTDYLSAAVAITAGAGLTGGGTTGAPFTIDVAPTDGSISVSANSIGVGVLQSDAQHGSLGGGSDHAVATHSVAGFMSAADKTNLDGLVSGGVPGSRLLIAGAGLTGGGDLTADRTFDVVPNADGSILVHPNDVQVGVLATDAQHGNRGGGSIHTVATTSAAGFMSSADKTIFQDATFLVQSTTNAPAAAFSLGALASGVLQHVVTGIISAPTSLAVVGGQIPFGVASGAGILDQDTAFFWDNTNKRLAIGTHIPSAALTIDHSGTNDSNTLLVINSNAGAGANASVAVSNLTAGGVLLMNGTGHPGGGTTPNIGTNVLALSTSIPGPTPTLYLGSHGVVTIQTGATQVERLRIDVSGNISASSLAAGGLVKSALTTGQLSIATPGTDYLVPSAPLTTGSVIFTGTSGALAQDNANFFWNDTNNRLGIGTNVPGVDLDVRDDASASTMVMVRNQGAGTAALAQFVATNSPGGGVGVAVGVAGTGFTATVGRPLVVANMPYVVPYFGSSNLYVGAPGTLIFATGATEATRLQILTSGLINVSSLAAGGVVQATSSSGQLGVVTMVAGEVPFGGASGGGLAQDVSLFFDNTNKRLGIGTNAPGADVTVTKSLNQFTTINVSTTGVHASGGAQLLANNDSGSGQALVAGITGASFTPFGSIPNLHADTPFVMNNVAGTPLYIGAVGDITIQTGATQAEALRILATGEVIARNKVVGSTTPFGSLFLQGTTNATRGSVTSNDAFGVGRSPGLNGVPPQFAVAGNVTVASSASATLDWTVFNAGTVAITGGTNITTAAGFNWVSIEGPSYVGTMAIGAGGTVPAAATLVVGAVPTISGGGSFTGLGAVSLWVKGPAVFDQGITFKGNLLEVTGAGGILIDAVGGNGLTINSGTSTIEINTGLGISFTGSSRTFDISNASSTCDLLFTTGGAESFRLLGVGGLGTVQFGSNNNQAPGAVVGSITNLPSGSSSVPQEYLLCRGPSGVLRRIPMF